jgi:predicted metalloprotease with PDZ domain
MAGLGLVAMLMLCTAGAIGSQPIVGYTIRVAPGNVSGFDVEMRIRNAPDTFRLAMMAHPEYDDRFWRFVQGLSVTAPNGRATITRQDSALWRVTAHGPVVLRYRIHLPPVEEGQRGAWRPFVTPTGALIGGPHSFMYIVGSTLVPSHVKVEAPAGWTIATGLEPTSDPSVFFAPNADILVDSPILVGNLRSWTFLTDGVPHRVVYWPLPNATPFDTVSFVGTVRRLTEEAIGLFGSAPYREYSFLFQDGAYGALEHLNSVTLGATSVTLATDQVDLLEETAHEYFHLWNLMRIRPVERTSVDYRPPRETRGLWFSEGLSMFYADLLLRRAGVTMHDTTRTAHLKGLIERYLGNSSYSHISPEESSLGAYRSSPGSFGDYSPSVHLQGELVGAMLDLIIRDATNGTRSVDDLMRSMLERHSGEKGFGGNDIERAVADVCSCQVKGFFDAHVRGTTPIDFNRYLSMIGMRTRVRWAPAVDDSGKAVPDFRISAWMPNGEQRLRLLVRDPNSVWARSGLHTGYQLVSVNGEAMKSWPDFRRVLRTMKVGSTLRFETVGPNGPFSASVVMSGHERPLVTIEQVAQVTGKQRRLREAWLAGRP